MRVKVAAGPGHQGCLWLPINDPIRESDATSPAQLSIAAVSSALTSNICPKCSTLWCVHSHRPAPILLMGCCLTQNAKTLPVWPPKATSTPLISYRAQHKWALRKCFLMRAMIAVVSAVGPSLTQEDNQELLLSDTERGGLVSDTEWPPFAHWSSCGPREAWRRLCFLMALPGP